jgi:hypothetical protein
MTSLQVGATTEKSLPIWFYKYIESSNSSSKGSRLLEILAPSKCQNFEFMPSFACFLSLH